MRLRRFNDVGIARFGAYLDGLAADPALPPPAALLEDDEASAPLPGDAVPIAAKFANRMAAARTLDELLSKVTGCDVERDGGLWTWLTLFYFDSVCPKDGNGRRKAEARARYIPAVTDYQKYYRHLLAGPYRVFRAHRTDPDRALVLLCGPVHRPGEIVEQLLSRQEIITNPSAVEAATEIYFDKAKGGFRRGAAGKGAGSARRLAAVLNQFDLTWDLASMTAQQLMERLPREFDRFAKPRAAGSNLAASRPDGALT